MPDAHVPSRLTVVHVAAPSKRGATSEMGARLSALETNGQLAVVAFDDVYQALARLGRDRDHRPDAILVCVDELTPAEDEFFDLAKRFCRNARIAVYGSRPACVQRALDMGLIQFRSPDELCDWLGVTHETVNAPRSHSSTSTPESMQRATRSAVEREPSAGAPRIAPVVAQLAPVPTATEAPLVPPHEPDGASAPPAIVVAEDADDADDEPDASADAPAEDNADPDVNAVRVPWLRYEGGPRRSSPDTPSDNDEPAYPSGSPKASSRRTYEPLLSDEELRALIGDDLASLGPERTPTRNDDTRREEGSG